MDLHASLGAYHLLNLKIGAEEYDNENKYIHQNKMLARVECAVLVLWHA
jgi:hypothetical protein